MKTLLVILMLCIAATSVAAVSGPFSFNGKNYYTVTSMDPTEDSGDEVCAKLGLACQGYTDSTTAVCQQANPGAATSSSSSGDKAGVYCNGAPQNGVCASKQNTCHACPACTVSVRCDQAIGGLYREMYAECIAPGAAGCKVYVTARNTNDFFTSIPGINAQLQNCQRALPKGAGFVLANGITQVDIVGTTVRSFTLTKTKGIITAIASGTAASCKQRMTLSEKDFDAILATNDRAGAVANMIAQKKISINGCNFFAGLRLFFVKPVVRIIAKRQAPNPPPPKPAPNCGQVGEQCNNRGCFSGMCGAPKENLNGQWGFWNYHCIDQNTYTANCLGRGNTPAAWNCLTGPCS
ncbi:hypothetical protein GOV07_03200 [Candidatus Woesearchaeota archaeon]|nr:hypothetical protein [Candidatus Woesearchaeota archaeon]